MSINSTSIIHRRGMNSFIEWSEIQRGISMDSVIQRREISATIKHKKGISIKSIIYK